MKNKKISHKLLLILFYTPFFNTADPFLEKNEQKIFSQNGEDGILQAIFNKIGTTNKFYVEFGVQDGSECNTRYLREKYNWRGIMWDGEYENKYINLFRKFITRENILDLFKQYHVPREFDLLSIDIDSNDWYIWRKISNRYKPRVVVIEYNASHPPTTDKIVQYNANAQWDGTNYFGASLLAYFRLARVLGYSLVFADSMGVNAFFIRDDVLKNHQLKNINNVEKIYKNPRYGPHNGGHPPDSKERKYTSAKKLLNLF